MEHAPHSPEQHSQPSPELHHQPPALEAKTPQERSIGSLEQLDINVQTKLELLLTVGGENPSYAMRYAIPVSANGEVAPDPEARKQIEAINGWAKSTGLPTEIVTFEPPAHDPSVTQTGGELVHMMILAKDQEELEKAKSEAHRANQLLSDDAIAAVSSDQMSRMEAFYKQPMPAAKPELPDVPAEVKAFARFGVAADKWPEELEQAKRRAEAARRLSPAIYNSVIDDFQKNQSIVDQYNSEKEARQNERRDAA